MQQHSIHQNHPDHAAETAPHHNLFATPPAFICALPADVAQLRPLFLAEPEEHFEPRDAR